MAPMVLENLACTGTEERLVDCPGSRARDIPDYSPAYDYFQEYYYNFPVVGCEPLAPSYAFVACGNTVGPGAASMVEAKRSPGSLPSI